MQNNLIEISENFSLGLNRTHRFVFETRTEHLEHVPKRIAGTFTSISIVKKRFSEVSMDIIGDMKNLLTLLHRSHRFVLKKRMTGTFTSISIVKDQFSEVSTDIVRNVKNLMIPLGRAHRFVL